MSTASRESDPSVLPVPVVPPIQRVAVYCASNAGVRPEYVECARALGALLAEWAARGLAGRPTVVAGWG